MLVIMFLRRSFSASLFAIAFSLILAALSSSLAFCSFRAFSASTANLVCSAILIASFCFSCSNLSFSMASCSLFASISNFLCSSCLDCSNKIRVLSASLALSASISFFL
jgi:hypothetical protein